MRRSSKRKSAHLSGYSNRNRPRLGRRSSARRSIAALRSDIVVNGDFAGSFNIESDVLRLTPRRLKSQSHLIRSSRKKETTQILSRRKLGLHIEALPDVCLLQIFSFFVCERNIDIDSFLAVQATSRRLHSILTSRELWLNVPMVIKETNAINWNSLLLVNLKNQGTEGICYHVYSRALRKHYALKRARVYPGNEGVPYYMMRELAALTKISHKNICPLEFVYLSDFKLYLFFPYAELSLSEILLRQKGGAELGDETATVRCSRRDVRELMRQLLEGVAYCHRRGIVHRNLKPKHLIIHPGPDPSRVLRGCTLQIADFALVRILGNHASNNYTSEVITLWYRPPEILMGLKNYSTAVDIWSCGCIFAELIQGRPLFTGLCEIDQLFQIFSKLGSATNERWEGFQDMPHFQVDLFPDWTSRGSQIRTLVDHASDDEISLLEGCLLYEPIKRISAENALSSSYFSCVHWDPAALADEDISLPPALCALTPRGPSVTPLGLPRTSVTQYYYLKQLESTMPALRSHGKSDLKIAKIAEWMLGILDKFDAHMGLRTVFFAMNLVHTFLALLSNKNQHRGSNKKTTSISTYKNSFGMLHNLRLTGATCLHIASKCEDVSYIGVRDLASSEDWDDDDNDDNDEEEDDEEYSSKDILEMEEVVLNVLGFDIYSPTVIDHLHILHLCLIPGLHPNAALQLPVFSNYMAELTLLKSKFLGYKPSLLAAAIIMYAIFNLNSPQISCWPREHEVLSGLFYAELLSVALVIREEHLAASATTCRVVFERYSRQENLMVALIAPRRGSIPPLAPLT